MTLLRSSLTFLSLSLAGGGFFVGHVSAGEFDIYRSQLSSRSYNEGLVATRKFAVITEKLENTHLGRMQCSYGSCIPKNILLTPEILQDLAGGKLSDYIDTNQFSAQDLAIVTSEANALLAELNIEASSEGQVVTEMSGFKIFTDGDEGNSGFDLMNDLNRINEVIFSKEITYPNTKNTLTLELDEMKKISDTKILYAYQSSQHKRQNSPKSDSSSHTTTTALESPGDAPALSTLLKNTPDLLCLPSDRVTITPSSQVNAPNTTLSRNIGSSDVSGAFGVSVSPSTRVNDSSNKCGPNTPICITSEMIKYSYPLFGGRTWSIDSVLSRHANIGQEYQHADFTPGKPTGQFFESNRTKLNLGANFTMQVVVGNLPMPSVNTDKRAKRDPKSVQSTPEALTDMYKEMVSQSFQAHGLTYGSYSKASERTANTDDLVTQCDPDTITSRCFDRLTQEVVNLSISESSTALPTSVTNDAWNEDIRSLSSFATSFAQNIELISKELDHLNNKPRQPQK